VEDRTCTGLSITAGYWLVWAERRTSPDPRMSEAEALHSAAMKVRCPAPGFPKHRRRRRRR
jgi:hypothetical protein